MINSVISSYWDVGPEFKEEGETCGACFTISGDCGKCKPGLECVPDENAFMIPDLPSRCRAPTQGISSFRFAIT